MSVTIAILAKDKAHCLPLYLRCIEDQTFPKNLTHLYIRTNNNNDATAKILADWVAKVRDQYQAIHFDSSDVPQEVQRFTPHEWNCERFKVLGAIRQASVEYARTHNTHYFVADCDNFIIPTVIEDFLRTNLPVIGPLLRKTTGGSLYANYHLDVDDAGYFRNHPHYLTILERAVVGIFQVPVLHCTYLIRHEVLPVLTYDDNSYRYEYVIFSDSLRKANIPQYIDNRKHWGYLTFADTKEELENEDWYTTLTNMKQ